MGYWNLLRDGYEEMVKCIIRPPRAEYDPRELGPPSFVYGNAEFRREDFEVTNPRGHKLKASMWRQASANGPSPCVVYLHGNASCRAEVAPALPPPLPLAPPYPYPPPCTPSLPPSQPLLIRPPLPKALGLLAPVLAAGASLCAFDFSGCGMSDGDYDPPP